MTIGNTRNTCKIHVEAMDAYCNTPDDYNIIFKTASVIPKGIIDKGKWVFTRCTIIGQSQFLI